MFHHISKWLTDKYLRLFLFTGLTVIQSMFCVHASAADAIEKREHLAAFDPAKGFRPAQSDLTEVFLQIAGSLEFYSSPEPYLRHMKAEHVRIEAKYQQQLGDKPRSFCPAYMDDAYFDQFAANWKHIAPQLGLESLTKSTGQLMCRAINGPDGKGTILADVFHRQQHEVDAAMSSKKTVPVPDFDSLKVRMVKCLRLDATPMQVENLTLEQQAVIGPANDAHAAFLKLFSAVDAGLTPADAEKVKAVINAIVIDVGRMAESEMEVASLEASLDYLHAPQTPYSVEMETALNTDERKTLAGFLKKPRFTRDDFPALDKFYKGPYDRLTERGKDEMSKRIHTGMRPAS